MPNVSIVVPTFNEGGNIEELVRRLATSFDGDDAEILFVDDSTDDTPDIIDGTARLSGLPVRMLHREGAERHGGLAGAVTDGIRSSESTYVVVMDGDLQHPPELAPLLRDTAQRQSADLVVASRYCGQGEASGLSSAFRRSVSSGSTLLARSLFPRRVGAKCTDPMTGFFCLRRDSVDLDRLRPRGFKILLEVLASHDLRVQELPFVFGERLAGESKASWANGVQFLCQLILLRMSRAARLAVAAGLALLLGLVAMAVLLAGGSSPELALLPPVLAFVAGQALRVVTTPKTTRWRLLSPRSGAVAAAESPFALPPTDEEKYAYLARPQHRWVFWFSGLAFLGVAYSLAGLASQSIWTAVFFIPLLVLALEQGLSLRTSAFKSRITPGQHQATIESWQPATHPAIDVFLPVRGESIDLLANTAAHVARLRWPGTLSVYLLDDGGDPAVRDLADRHGFTYLARPTHEFKKAGNLQHGYRHSDGEHIAILDADFVPHPDFLLELVPYLDDPSTGIVQSPQYFDTRPTMGWLERTAGATQELFFRLIQPSRDAVGAAICVGTSAIYRRAALEAIGGFPQIGHSEDVFTGVQLGTAGYRLRYVPVLVSRGKCPDDIDAFIGQQYRWCEGSMALASDVEFHDEPSFSLDQRVSFWSGFLYYLSTAMNAVLAPLPILVMLFFFPRNISALNMLPLVGVIVLWVAVLPLVSYGRWRPEVLRVQTIYGFAHLFCIVDMVRGRVTEWVPTGAGATTRRSVASRVHALLGPYLLLTQLLVLAGLVRGTLDYGLLSFWANIVVALFGAYIFVPVAWASLTAAYRGRATVRAEAAAPATPSALMIDLIDATTSDGNDDAAVPSPSLHPRAPRLVLEGEPS